MIEKMVSNYKIANAGENVDNDDYGQHIDIMSYISTKLRISLKIVRPMKWANINASGESKRGIQRV